MRARLLSLYNWFLRPIPFAKLSELKKAYLRLCGVKIHKSVTLSFDVTIRGHGEISIGEGTTIAQGVCIESLGGVVEIGSHCEINHGSYIAANFGSRVTIGNNVHIAHNCSIKGSTHEIDENIDRPSIAGKSKFLNITIGDGSWVCAGVIILPNVSIGRMNVLAAGAVVIKDTPDGVLMAGVPAEIKKKYHC